MELGVEPTPHYPDPQSFAHSILVLNAKFAQRRLRAARPLAHEFVAAIIEIGDPDLARPEPGRRHVAEHVEERDALTHLRLRLLGPRDVVENRGALGLRRL